MKKIVVILITLMSVFVYSACDVSAPDQPELENVTQNQLAARKVVAIGNSLTAGFQSSGLSENMQMYSYPKLIAQQMGKTEFEQPIISEPGIGSTAGKTPLRFNGGNIAADDLTANPLTLLANALLSRPYDNLGVPGATLKDAMDATSSTTVERGENPFMDIVLRNPNLGQTSQVQQAVLLNPTMILLWIGNNDVLAAALAGGNSALITSTSDFQTRYTNLVNTLRSNTKAVIVAGNIPYVTDIPFVNSLDGIFEVSALTGTSVPVVSDANLQPVDFGGGLYVPLLTEEQGVQHLTISALSLYKTGTGVPDSTALIALGLPAAQAKQLHLGMMQSGLNPTGQPLPGSVTITATEADAIRSAVDAYNGVIMAEQANGRFVMVDMNATLSELNSSGIDGASGLHPLFDPASTAFSLDGVHPNNAGYAIVANRFLAVIGQVIGTTLPPVSISDKLGQYTGAGSAAISFEAAEQVKSVF